MYKEEMTTKAKTNTILFDSAFTNLTSEQYQEYHDYIVGLLCNLFNHNGSEFYGVVIKCAEKNTTPKMMSLSGIYTDYLCNICRDFTKMCIYKDNYDRLIFEIYNKFDIIKKDKYVLRGLTCAGRDKLDEYIERGLTDTQIINKLSKSTKYSLPLGLRLMAKVMINRPEIIEFFNK